MLKRLGTATLLLVAAGAATATSPAIGVAANPTPAGQSPLNLADFLTAVAVVDRMPVPVNDPFRVAVEFKVSEGFHVNANPASEETFIATEVTVDSPGVAILGVTYPEAKKVTFEFWGEPLQVYQGSVVAGVRMRINEAAALGPRNLDFSVRYQACNETVCFAPATATARLAVDVVHADTPARLLTSPLLDRARFSSSASDLQVR